MFTRQSSIICVGAGSSQLSLIRAIKKVGYKCIAFDRNPNAPGKSEADFFFPCSTHDYFRAIKKIAETRNKLKAVMVKAAGYPVMTAAHIARAFNLDFLKPDIAEKLIWKNNLVEFSVSNNLKVAPSLTHFTLEDVRPDFLPAVLRPNKDIRGRSTCYRVNNEAELKGRLNGNSTAGGFTLSKFIEGEDIALITVFNQDLNEMRGVWLRELNQFQGDGAIRFDGFKIINVVPDFIIDQATAIVDTIIQQAGATRGCFSFAFRVAKDGALYLIEVHPDLGGEFIMDKLIPEYFEQPFLEDLVQFIAGEIKHINYLPKVIRPMIQGVSINIPKVS